VAIEGFQPVAKIGEVPPGQSKVVTLNNRTIALFNIEGKLFAIQ
jgi:nitrite reductase (NADH) small subunit